MDQGSLPARLRWLPRKGSWLLFERGRRPRCIAHVGLDRYGWLVTLANGEHAGPYGDLEVARQLAERRSWATMSTRS